ncbi:MAG: AEC family transporter [Epsilonproteobacteria bacterium]|nr:AEC family transporter [Campylobacterota bacterium]
MISVIFSIFCIYIFIAIGFIAKMSFKEAIDDKTITITNVYFLQIFLTFWGLLVRPVDIKLFYAPLVYTVVVMIVLIFLALISKRIFLDKKDFSIATVVTIIGNTGNLGIPINIAIFGEESIPYTTVINLANVFIVYTVGVYFYSRGSFDIKTSLKNILKLPILWAAAAAIIISIKGYALNDEIMKTLMMGAYTSIVMQLFLFGIYLYGSKIKEVNIKLTMWVVGVKFLILPIVAFLILQYIKLDSMTKGIIFLELLMPFAIANVNFASLYNCKPKVVTSLVFISSLVFLGVIFAGIKVLAYL